MGIAGRLAGDKEYSEAVKYVEAQRNAGNISEADFQKLLGGLRVDKQRADIDTMTTAIRNGNFLPVMDDNGVFTFRMPSLREALDQADEQSKGDIELAKAVKMQLRQEYAQDDALKAKEYSDLRDRVEDVLSDRDKSWRDVKAEDWALLTERDRNHYLEGQRKDNDFYVMEELVRNPQMLTEAYLQKHRNDLTRSTYLQLLQEAKKPPAERNHEPTIDADHLDTLLMQEGYDRIVKPVTSQDIKDSLAIRDSIKTEIDVEQGRIKRGLSWEEKDTIMRQALQRKGALMETHWFSEDTVGTPQLLAKYSAHQLLYEVRDAEGNPLLTVDDRKKIAVALTTSGMQLTE
jgi:hypothetical protein